MVASKKDSVSKKKNNVPDKKNGVSDKGANGNGVSSMDLLRDISAEIGGKNGSLLVDLLNGKKHVNEFLIAKRLELTINQTRNILYKLSDESLVSSVRKKDKKKGWYTYFWTFNVDNALILLRKIIIRDIEQLEHQLDSRQQKRFYKCKICGIEVTEENALTHDFTCDECGEIYELNDSSKVINEISGHILKLKRKLEAVQTELEVIEAKKAKKIEAENRKIEKEKAEKRAEKRAEKKKLADKLAKKEGKKVKKKVVKKKAVKKAKKKVVKKAKKKVAKKKAVKKAKKKKK